MISSKNFVQRKRMATDYSNPNKLGFIRVLEVLWVINILFTIMSLIVLSKGQWNLGFIGWRDVFNVVLEGVTLWLLWQRKKVARYAIIAFASFTIVVGTVYNIATGAFAPVSALLNSAFDIVLILYFAFSKRAKAVLTEPFSQEIADSKQTEHSGYFQWRTWPFWRNLIIFYCVFSVMGHWMEAGFCLLVKYGIFPGVYDPTSQIWSDYLYPFPVYGIGFCVCVLVFFPIKQWLRKKFKGLLIPLLLSFIVSTIICAGIELALGLATNMPANPGDINPLWDYSDMPFNFMGQICLLYSSAFGVAATFMTWMVYPAIMKGFEKIPREGMNIMFTAVAVGYVLLLALYYINPDLSEVNKIADEYLPKENSHIMYVEVTDNHDVATYIVDNPSEELRDAIKAEATALPEGSSK